MLATIAVVAVAAIIAFYAVSLWVDASTQPRSRRDWPLLLNIGSL